MKRAIFLSIYLFLFLAGAGARLAAPASAGVVGPAVFGAVHLAADAKTETATFYVSALENKEKVKAAETQLYAVKGVTEVKCNLITRTITITYRTGETSKTRLASALRKIGMEALPVDNGAGCPVPPAGRQV